MVEVVIKILDGHYTWEEFEKLFSDKWIRDTKMEEMYRIQDELKESNLR
jgi:hypothetical protein